MPRVIAALVALALPTAAAAGDLPVGLWQGVVQAGAQSVPVGLALQTRAGGPGCVATFPTQPNPPRCTATLASDGRLMVEVPATQSRFSLAPAAGGAVLEGTYASSTTPSQPIRMTLTTGDELWAPDPTPHRQLFVSAPDGVRIEVLDFGGQGSPVVLIPGLGAGGHVFDAIAPRLAANHRVVAVTRRGYGASDTPALTPENYTARKQGDDVLAVMAALGIERATLAAWSIGGSEIGSVASRHPEKVSAAIYLDAAYAYSYFAPRQGAVFNPTRLLILRNDLNSRLEGLVSGPPGPGRAQRAEAIRRDLLPEIEAELAASEAWLKANPAPASVVAAAARPGSPATATGAEFSAVGRLVSSGVERFGPLSVPILAIFAVGAPEATADQRATIDSYKAGNPSARVVEIPGAQHAVFGSHPEEVLAAMENFMGAPARRAAPGGAAVVRRFMAAVLRGEPDYAVMTPAGAQSLRNGLAAQQAALRSLGQVRDVALVGVAPDGRERYRVVGSGGAVEYSIARARPSGAVTHAAFKVAPRNAAAHAP